MLENIFANVFLSQNIISALYRFKWVKMLYLYYSKIKLKKLNMIDLNILEESKKIVKELVNELVKKHPDLWDEIEIVKGTYLYKIGEPIKKIYYCKAGITRIFSEDTAIEKEVTNGFFSESEMIIPLFALTKRFYRH